MNIPAGLAICLGRGVTQNADDPDLLRANAKSQIYFPDREGKGETVRRLCAVQDGLQPVSDLLSSMTAEPPRPAIRRRAHVRR